MMFHEELVLWLLLLAITTVTLHQIVCMTITHFIDMHHFSITRERTEIVVQGTYDHPDSPHAVWHDYEFKCKPGSVTRIPCLISPYHYRLDWLMWFAAFQVCLLYVTQQSP